jgi:hypothetical protein
MFLPQAVWLKVHMILQRALQLAFGWSFVATSCFFYLWPFFMQFRTHYFGWSFVWLCICVPLISKHRGIVELLFWWSTFLSSHYIWFFQTNLPGLGISCRWQLMDSFVWWSNYVGFFLST